MLAEKVDVFCGQLALEDITTCVKERILPLIASSCGFECTIETAKAIARSLGRLRWADASIVCGRAFGFRSRSLAPCARYTHDYHGLVGS